MSIDFTISVYKKLLKELSGAGYSFQTFEDFITKPAARSIVLRHDVDRIPKNAQKMAEIEHSVGINASYFFRVVSHVWDENIMKTIVDLGHEVAYHYEDMTLVKGDFDKAIKHFEKQLTRFRKIYPSKTICMHGSPMSKWDNRKLWEKYNYRDYGLIAEPYFDLDFSKVLYLTDTGRRWDGEGVSIRDKVIGVKSSSLNESKQQNAQRSNHLNSSTPKPLSKEYSFRSTQEIINAAKSGKLPNQIMFNFHPQRWTDNPVLWTQELVMQNVKNMVKWVLVRFR